VRVLVTGAGGGIGRSLCLALSERGFDVVASARRKEQIPTGERIEPLVLDVTDPESVSQISEFASQIDAVVNNAAINPPGPLEFVDPQRLAGAFDTNVLGPLRIIQALAPAWRKRGSGVIVNISSIQGRVATPLDGAYATTKFALEGLSETLHIELGHFGVRVVIVEPGYVGDGMAPLEKNEGDGAYGELSQEWERAVATLIGPGGRPGSTIVSQAVIKAIEEKTTPLRVSVGDLAHLVLSARASMNDQEFEAAMRSMLSLTW